MTSETPLSRLSEICALAPVIPRLTIHNAFAAAPLARAMVAGGLPAVEISIVEPGGLDAIRAIRAEAPETIVGAGGLRRALEVDEALVAGAQFGVSACTTDELADAAVGADMPFLPGCATLGEAARLAEKGLEILRLYPAGLLGGPRALAAFRAALPELAFSPAGMIEEGDAAAYLREPNVICLGADWLAPEGMTACEDWTALQALAQKAAELGRLRVG